MSTALAELRQDLLATHHVGRIARMLELGREAKTGDKTGSAALSLIDALSGGDVFERRLVLYALQTFGDGERLLPFTEDKAASLRSLAFKIVPQICDDEQALRALRTAFALRRDRELLQALARRRRRPVIDRYLDWLSGQSDLQEFADLVPLCTEAGVRRHLKLALEQPSKTFWRRLASFAPAALAGILGDRLGESSGEPDARTRQLIDAHIGQIIEKAPLAGIQLLEQILRRGIRDHLRYLNRAGTLHPRATLRLIERLDLHPSGAPFARSAGLLVADELKRIAARDPRLLGTAKKMIETLPPKKLAAVQSGWLQRLDERPIWGLDLFAHLDDPATLERAYDCWTIAARDPDGIIQMTDVIKLPEALREREARRHLSEVVALHTQPLTRMRYARFLPWDEAKAAINDQLGYPDGAVRGQALECLLAIPGFYPDQPQFADKALELVKSKKNEQDPVRGSMLSTLGFWPRRIWQPRHTPMIREIVRDTLDAGDLSPGTAAALGALIMRTFGIDPASGAHCLASLIKERGALFGANLGLYLSDEEVSIAAPELLKIAEQWAKVSSKTHQVAELAESLGTRLLRVPGLPALLGTLTLQSPYGGTSRALLEVLARHDPERYEALLPKVLERWRSRSWNQEVLDHCVYHHFPFGVHKLSKVHYYWNYERTSVPKQPPLLPLLARELEAIARGRGLDHQVTTALTRLRGRALGHFDAILGDLLRSDPSYICVPVVYLHLHSKRQDLLDRFLSGEPIRGRFATGKSAWILPFERGFYRWTPTQNRAFATLHATILNDRKRDTPSVWQSLKVYAALDSAPMNSLAGMAEDPRPAIQERALRVMARCDRNQCVPTLLRCLDDARARIAIYGFRRALKSMLPDRAVAILRQVPLRRVTISKEVFRLLGQLRSANAYDVLIEFEAGDLHRDARIALLRALWDHLDREPTWEIFAKAVHGPDWVMASRLAEIPADRLTQTSDRRLSALLAKVLERPEPEARINLLQRGPVLAIRDPERSFLRACAHRLCSPYDDEITAAVRALLYRSTEVDLRSFPELLRNAMTDVRSLQRTIETLCAHPIKNRESWIGAARAAAQVLADDPHRTSLWIRCTAAAEEGPELATALCQLGSDDLLRGSALETAKAALATVHIDRLDPVLQILIASPSAATRWLAIEVLRRDAGPDRGWTPKRLAHLRALQDDPTPEVAGAALAVLLPRTIAELAELAELTERAKLAASSEDSPATISTNTNTNTKN